MKHEARAVNRSRRGALPGRSGQIEDEASAGTKYYYKIQIGHVRLKQVIPSRPSYRFHTVRYIRIKTLTNDIQRKSRHVTFVDDASSERGR
jgi:hypothetical protein